MLFQFDDLFYSRDIGVLCGVDEAGRGPLAGPVIAAAVVLPRGVRIEGLRDSKKLTPKMRLKIFDEITDIATQWSTGRVETWEIEELNIHTASLKAMKIALGGMKNLYDLVLVDGRFKIPISIPQVTLIGGDGLSSHIAAASVVAKVVRDRIMNEYHEEFPRYNFAKNKGYPTLEHREAIKKYGPTPIHRRTFKGVKEFFGG